MADVQHILCANNMVQHLDIFFLMHASHLARSMTDKLCFIVP